MHASQFNIVLPGPTDRTFVYNSFTDHCCELDAELADLYRPGAPFDGAPLPAEHESFFEADGHDEVGEYEGMLEQTLADDSELQFTIATTLACNFACSYCYQHSMQHRPSMTRATASEVAAWMLTRIACHQPERVVCKFIGGEPLLNSEAMFHILTALAQPLREADIELTLSMTTNGWFLEPALISRLQAFAPLTVVVTLDGVGDAHNRTRPLRNGQPTFARIMKNLVRLRGICRPIINGLYLDDPQPLFKLVDYLADHALQDHIAAIRLGPATPGLAHPDWANDFAAANCVQKTCEIIALHRHILEAGFCVADQIACGPCQALRKHSYALDPIGDLYLCAETYGRPEFRLGSIASASQLREKDRPPLRAGCRRCEYLPLCGGGCPSEHTMRLHRSAPPPCNKPYLETVGLYLIRERHLGQDVPNPFTEGVLHGNPQEAAS
ncbi:MAG: hypothetical protein A2284_08560 [Deltaproteobacteria bacterium RIFOXYA12_FULL_61_11]|nr:MAG: hypothetical protein A2284_08560 [Deltaproteobacteria bacterium RIFOXYA12_FULL_61_11]